MRLTEKEPQDFPEGLDGCVVCSDDKLLADFSGDQINLALGVGSVSPVGSDHLRRRIVARLIQSGYKFPPVTHSSAWVADTAVIGRGAQIHAGAVVQPGAVIGDFAIVNTGATVDHDCRVGQFAHLAPGVTVSGDVEVGEGSHIGTGASVIQGVQIGREVMVAAGAVVVSNLEDYSVVMGVPARQRT